MAEYVVNFVLETIGNMVIDEAKFLRGVEDQVQQLQLKLDRMLSFLRNAEARQDEQGDLKVWISQTRDLAYEAADLLERFAFKIASQKENISKRSVLNECNVRHSIASEIQSLQSKISGLTKSFQDYGIRAIREGEDPRSSSQQQPRRTYSHVVEDDFIGVVSDVELLVGHLVNENDADLHGVVSICGTGGLGKTTLARKVYNHPKVQRYFENLAWVCISQHWREREILQGILLKFFPWQSVAGYRDEELIRKLFETVQSRKCLVVLDDIWSTDAWERIKDAFPIAKKGSKLLLTTRIRRVALHISPNGFHYEPRVLSDNESWELLQLKAFRGRTFMGLEEMHEMERLGREMVKHCGGLPLAVVVLGGILVTKRDINGWESVHKNVRAYIGRGENMEEEGKIGKILALSYKDLPPKLKPCFLYLGSFPEDSDIDVEKLCQLWIAEGMISIKDQIGEESMMDVAKRYLGELAERSMVQVKVDEDFDGMKSCRLHDLIRDLSLEKAKEENFFLFVHSRNGFDDQVYKSSSSTHQIHRLVINFWEEDVHKYVPPQERTTRHLRSLRLLVEPDKYWRDMLQTIMSQISWLRMLRVLEIEVNDDLMLPEAIGNFIHLRYLSLRSDSILFPSSIGNLKHLETLDLLCFRLLTKSCWTQDVLRKMRHLKYLYLREHKNSAFHDFWSASKFQLEGLDKLEILEGFHSKFHPYKSLLKLTNLRKLDAKLYVNQDDTAEMIKFISNSKYLVDVSLRVEFPGNDLLTGEICSEILRKLFSCESLRKLSVWHQIRNFPKFEPHFAADLISLSLISSELTDDPMETLERLPNLRNLFLYRDSFVGTEMQCGATGFPQLRTLKLEGLTTVVIWTIAEGSMPNLSSLGIESCWELEMIPDGLRFITTLKELRIFYMPKEFKSRIQVIDGREGEDFDKIRHVPLVKVSRW